MKLRLPNALKVALMAATSGLVFTTLSTGATAFADDESSQIGTESNVIRLDSFSQEKLTTLGNSWTLSNLSVEEGATTFTSGSTAATITENGTSITTSSSSRYIYSTVVTVDADSAFSKSTPILSGEFGLAVDKGLLKASYQGSTWGSSTSIRLSTADANADGTFTFGMSYFGDGGTTIYVGDRSSNMSGLKDGEDTSTLTLAGTSGVTYSNLYVFNTSLSDENMQATMAAAGTAATSKTFTWNGTTDSHAWNLTSDNQVWTVAEDEETAAAAYTWGKQTAVFGTDAGSKTVTMNSGYNVGSIVNVQDDYTFETASAADDLTLLAGSSIADGKHMTVSGSGTLYINGSLTGGSTSILEVAGVGAAGFSTAGQDLSGFKGTIRYNFENTSTHGRTVSVADSFTGTLEVRGRMQLNSTTNFGGASLLVFNGDRSSNNTGVWDSNGTYTIDKKIEITGDNEVQFFVSKQLTLTGALSGTGSLKKQQDAGKLIVTGGGSITSLTIGAGTFESSTNALTIGTLTPGSGTTTILEKTKATLSSASSSVAGNLTIGADSTITVGGTDSLNYGGSNTITVNSGGTLSFETMRWTVGTNNKIVLGGGTISGAGDGTNGALDFYQQASTTEGQYSINVTDSSEISANIRLRNIGHNQTVNVADGKTLTLSGTINGSGGLVFSGTGGTVAMSSANTYTGTTAIKAGTTLKLTGTAATPGTGAVTVGSGAALELAQSADYTTANVINFLDGNSKLNITSGKTVTLGASLGLASGATGTTAGAVVLSNSSTLALNDQRTLTLSSIEIGSGSTLNFNTNSGNKISAGSTAIKLTGGTILSVDQNGTNNHAAFGALTVTEDSTIKSTWEGGMDFSSLTGSGALNLNAGGGSGGFGVVITDVDTYTGTITQGGNYTLTLGSVKGGLSLTGAATLSGDLKSSGGFTKTGDGAISITGTTTFVGSVDLGGTDTTTTLGSIVSKGGTISNAKIDLSTTKLDIQTATELNNVSFTDGTLDVVDLKGSDNRKACTLSLTGGTALSVSAPADGTTGGSGLWMQAYNATEGSYSSEIVIDSTSSLTVSTLKVQGLAEGSSASVTTNDGKRVNDLGNSTMTLKNAKVTNNNTSGDATISATLDNVDLTSGANHLTLALTTGTAESAAKVRNIDAAGSLAIGSDTAAAVVNISGTAEAGYSTRVKGTSTLIIDGTLNNKHDASTLSSAANGIEIASGATVKVKANADGGYVSISGNEATASLGTSAEQNHQGITLSYDSKNGTAVVAKYDGTTDAPVISNALISLEEGTKLQLTDVTIAATSALQAGSGAVAFSGTNVIAQTTAGTQTIANVTFNGGTVTMGTWNSESSAYNHDGRLSSTSMTVTANSTLNANLSVSGAMTFAADKHLTLGCDVTIANNTVIYIGSAVTDSNIVLMDSVESSTIGSGVSVRVGTADNYTEHNDYYVFSTGNQLLVAPEPATATLSLLALAGLCARRRRK